MCVKIYILFYKSEVRHCQENVSCFVHIAEMTHVIEHCRSQTITGNKSERAIRVSIFFSFWKKNYVFLFPDDF